MYGYVAVAVVLVFFAIALIAGGRRARAIRTFARRLGLTPCCRVVPPDFPIAATSFAHAYRFQNVYAGEVKGRRVIFFDCQLGYSRSARFPTVIAFAGIDKIGPERFDLSLAVERAEGWTLIFHLDASLAAEEMESIVTNL